MWANCRELRGFMASSHKNEKEEAGYNEPPKRGANLEIIGFDAN